MSWFILLLLYLQSGGILGTGMLYDIAWVDNHLVAESDSGWVIFQDDTWKYIPRPENAACVNFSPNGLYLACNLGNTITIWDISAGLTEMPVFLATIESSYDVDVLGFSDDSRLIVYGVLSVDLFNRYDALNLADVQTGAHLAVLETNVYEPIDVAFANGQIAVLANEHLRVADVNTVTRLGTMATQTELFFKPVSLDVLNIALSPDGRWLAYGDGQSSIQVINTETWQVQYVLSEQRGFSALTFAPDSSQLAAVIEDMTTPYQNRILFFDTDGFDLIHDLTFDVPVIASLEPLVFRADGERFAYADQQVIIWNRTGENITPVHRHTAFDADSVFLDEQIATVNEDEIVIWQDGLVAAVWDEQPLFPEIGVLDNQLVSLTASGEVIQWDGVDSRLLMTINHPITYALFGGEFLAISGADGLYLANVADGSIIQLSTATPEVMTFNADGRLFAAAIDSDIYIWDTDIEQKIAEVVMPYLAEITALAIHPNDQWIAVANSPIAVTMWHIPTNQQIGTLTTLAYPEMNDPSFRQWISAIQFVEDGQKAIVAGGWYATNGMDGTIWVFDADTGQVLQVLDEATSPITRLTLHGDTLLSHHLLNESVRIWTIIR